MFRLVPSVSVLLSHFPLFFFISFCFSSSVVFPFFFLLSFFCSSCCACFFLVGSCSVFLVSRSLWFPLLGSVFSGSLLWGCSSLVVALSMFVCCSVASGGACCFLAFAVCFLLAIFWYGCLGGSVLCVCGLRFELVWFGRSCFGMLVPSFCLSRRSISSICCVVLSLDLAPAFWFGLAGLVPWISLLWLQSPTP